MVFYKGALSWEVLRSMPVDQLADLNDNANRIMTEAERESKNGL
jgi:hypothetical protein